MNKLYQGDNLKILQEMPDNSVDLIATDPPFNTGKDWGAFNDKWEGGLKGYLKFMEARCVEMHRVLKDTGSFYLHCDPTASHYLKVMLDGVFGIRLFRNEIIWHYVRLGVSNKRFATNHDSILYYAKTDTPIINWEDIMVPHAKSSIERAKYKPSKSGWATEWSKIKSGRGKRPNNIWYFPFGSTDKQRLGYPTQKPIALYERIIKASSNQGNVVLDPFAGSGTTLDAAHTLGRHWIGIDQSDPSIETIIKRLRDRHGLEHDRDYELTTDTSRNPE